MSTMMIPSSQLLIIWRQIQTMVVNVNIVTPLQTQLMKTQMQRKTHNITYLSFSFFFLHSPPQKKETNKQYQFLCIYIIKDIK